MELCQWSTEDSSYHPYCTFGVFTTLAEEPEKEEQHMPTMKVFLTTNFH
jgi:hypothetical protein